MYTIQLLVIMKNNKIPKSHDYVPLIVPCHVNQPKCNDDYTKRWDFTFVTYGWLYVIASCDE